MSASWPVNYSGEQTAAPLQPPCKIHKCNIDCGARGMMRGLQEDNSIKIVSLLRGRRPNDREPFHAIRALPGRSEA
jgi:hypothetical protein